METIIKKNRLETTLDKGFSALGNWRPMIKFREESSFSIYLRYSDKPRINYFHYSLNAAKSPTNYTLTFLKHPKRIFGRNAFFNAIFKLDLCNIHDFLNFHYSKTSRDKNYNHTMLLFIENEMKILEKEYDPLFLRPIALIFFPYQKEMLKLYFRHIFYWIEVKLKENENETDFQYNADHFCRPKSDLSPLKFAVIFEVVGKSVLEIGKGKENKVRQMLIAASGVNTKNIALMKRLLDSKDHQYEKILLMDKDQLMSFFEKFVDEFIASKDRKETLKIKRRKKK